MGFCDKSITECFFYLPFCFDSSIWSTWTLLVRKVCVSAFCSHFLIVISTIYAWFIYQLVRIVRSFCFVLFCVLVFVCITCCQITIVYLILILDSEPIVTMVQLLFAKWFSEFCVTIFGWWTWFWIIPWLNLTRCPNWINYSCYHEYNECDPEHQSPFVECWLKKWRKILKNH